MTIRVDAPPHIDPVVVPKIVVNEVYQLGVPSFVPSGYAHIFTPVEIENYRYFYGIQAYLSTYSEPPSTKHFCRLQILAKDINGSTLDQWSLNTEYQDSIPHNTFDDFIEPYRVGRRLLKGDYVKIEATLYSPWALPDRCDVSIIALVGE